MMFLPLIIVIVLILFYANPTHYRNYSSKNNALDILDRRFANGEINEEEYLKRSSILKEK